MVSVLDYPPELVEHNMQPMEVFLCCLQEHDYVVWEDEV